MAKERLFLQVDEEGLHLPIADGQWHIDGQTTYSALEMLLASTAACGASVFRDLLKNSEVAAKLTGVKIDFTRHEERPRPIKSITLTFLVDAEDDKAKRRASQMTRFVSRYCPVIQSLDPDIDLKEVVEFI
ncbi:hypothetical protein AWM75_05690 [Aerococcus urinaehominis]|uniref:Uncharacterized protein n=1 Tax=Aerococcus urinaehominis TaxID=128944 RepID=A0A120IAY1_9LACT|nr:OsmC family protein [Aerococcus urinaehominis]AMB99519.1 hypothetical protein AWM75_05690 [Aerococcus urinaehominis]SDM25588.1 Uncharacterized OsmC-related protein [Aerococcus urinaehominis]